MVLQFILEEASTTTGHQDASVLCADCKANGCSHVSLHQQAINKLSVVQTARLKLARGLLELAVPLRLKAGPTVMLHMKACLLTPDVQLSSPTLPFGPVQTGKCKVPSSPSLKSPRPSSLSSNCLLTILSCCLLPGWYQENPFCLCPQVMMVLMHNTREVPAEWQVKPPADVAAAADWSHFKCEPEQGLLPPGQKQLLKVQHISLTTCSQFASLCHLLPYAILFCLVD